MGEVRSAVESQSKPRIVPAAKTVYVLRARWTEQKNTLVHLRSVAEQRQKANEESGESVKISSI